MALHRQLAQAARGAANRRGLSTIGSDCLGAQSSGFAVASTGSRRRFAAEAGSDSQGHVWSPAALPDSTAAARMPAEDRTAGAVLKHALADLGVDVYIGSAVGARRPLSAKLPGNGGIRMLKYSNSKDAAEEAVALAQGMEIKHSLYNTGFAGSKVVVDVSSDKIDVSQVDKKRLMDSMAKLLNELDGTVYVGCDLNTTTADMDDIRSQSPYVLAGIPNQALNPNFATAHGVVGSLEAVAGEKYGGIQNARFVVHGCGSVGARVASELVSAGAKSVHVCDAVPGRGATIEGAVDASEAVAAAGSDWASALPEHDIFVPCSISHLIDAKAAAALPAENVVGATNLPFASPEVEASFIEGGRLFVPEGITSAGAVIADSIEAFDTEAFREAVPEQVYSFCQAAVRSKVGEAMELAESTQQPVADTVPLLPSVGKPVLSSGSDDTNLIGQRFRSWKAQAFEATAGVE